jgi:DNA repair photolyase
MVLAAKSKTAIIYETRGKAREYCELAANLYKGCGHGCVYCYAPDATFSRREAFDKPEPRPGILEKLQLDAARMSFPWSKETRPILLSFTCDPYQPIDEKYQLTRQGIQVIKHYGLKVMLLTKGGKRAERDFDLLTPEDAFGVTLTLLDKKESLEWEPYAGLPEERIGSLKKAHNLGIPTWVSLEPVINPGTTLEIIQQTHEFVDEFKVGVLNYHPRARQIDWGKFARDVVNTLEELGCKYYLKEDLRRWI